MNKNLLSPRGAAQCPHISLCTTGPQNSVVLVGCPRTSHKNGLSVVQKVRNILHSYIV